MKRLVAIIVAGTAIALLLCWAFKPRGTRGGYFIGSSLPTGPSLPAGKVAPQLFSEWDTGILLAPDGSLWIWGGQNQNPLIKPGVFDRPQRIGSEVDWRKVALGSTHILMLKNDGSLWGMGNNYAGQLAQSKGTRTNPKPAQIGTETNWMEISSGAGHGLALKTDGSLWAWGQNESGQIGNGTTSNQNAPTRIDDETGWKSIAAGAFNGYALKTNGTIWGWGLDFVVGGAPTKKNILSPIQIDPDTNWARISASDFVLMALKSDGTLWIRGQNAHWVASYYVRSLATNFIQIGNDTNWADFFVGQGDFFARKRDGSWWACGNNLRGEIGPGWSPGIFNKLESAPLDFDPWAFTTGTGNTLVLTRDGTLWTWGERIGSKAPTMQDKLKMIGNKLLNLIPKHQQRSVQNAKSPVVDAYPYHLWELPADVRRNLGTNSSANERRN